MAEQYHCAWIDPYAGGFKEATFDDLEPVLELVKENEKSADDFSNVRRLVVVYGERLEFEPATVVQTYRVKPRFENLRAGPAGSHGVDSGKGEFDK